MRVSDKVRAGPSGSVLVRAGPCGSVRVRAGPIGSGRARVVEFSLYRSIYQILLPGWLGSRVVSVLNSVAEQPGFKSQSRRCRVTVFGKLFKPIVPLFTKQQKFIVAALLRVAMVTAGLTESNCSLLPGL